MRNWRIFVTCMLSIASLPLLTNAQRASSSSSEAKQEKKAQPASPPQDAGERKFAQHCGRCHGHRLANRMNRTSCTSLTRNEPSEASMGRFRLCGSRVSRLDSCRMTKERQSNDKQQEDFLLFWHRFQQHLQLR